MIKSLELIKNTKKKKDIPLDEGHIVILFNGFQKKTQKTPDREIDKALKLKKEYYERKRTKDV